MVAKPQIDELCSEQLGLVERIRSRVYQRYSRLRELRSDRRDVNEPQSVRESSDARFTWTGSVETNLGMQWRGEDAADWARSSAS